MSREPEENPFGEQPTGKRSRNPKRTPSSIISSFVGKSNTLPIPTILLDYFSGNYNLAVLTSQLLYWSDRTHSKEGWIYKTHDDWYAEIYLRRRTVQRTAARLKEIGWLETKIKKANGFATVHYRLVFEKFEADLLDFIQHGTLPEGVQNDD